MMVDNIILTNITGKTSTLSNCILQVHIFIFQNLPIDIITGLSG